MRKHEFVIIFGYIDLMRALESQLMKAEILKQEMSSNKTEGSYIINLN